MYNSRIKSQEAINMTIKEMQETADIMCRDGIKPESDGSYSFWTIKDGKAHKYSVWPGKRRRMPSLNYDRYPLSESEYRMILAKRIRQSELNEYVDKNLHRLPEYVIENWQDDNAVKSTAFFDDLFKYIESKDFSLHDTISDIDFIEETRKNNTIA